MRDILTEAILQLPDHEQLVFTLYYYEGLTTEEISFVLGETEARVAALEKECMELDAGLRWALEELRKKKILPPAILSICP